MKILCCLCFTEDEGSSKMKEGFSAIEEDSDGNIQNNEDVQMQLGLSLDMFGAETNTEPARFAPSVNFNDVFTDTASNDNDGDLDPITRRSGGWLPVLREPRRYDGESSSSAGGSGLAIDDSLHKRAKVYSASSRHQYLTAVCLDDGRPSSFASSDYNSSLGSVVPCNNEIFYHDFMWNSSGDEKHIDPTGRKEDGDDNGTSKMEDLEIRMDLTDDLLHMVFSFLEYVDLCRAAMVCRQWRAASAHEDFWRCLNFENRKISVEQCNF